jgi:Rod binding domain-containing protein
MNLDSAVTFQAEQLLANRPVAPSLGKKANEEQAKKVARDFESFFIAQMLQPMFREVDPAEPFSGGPGEDVWRSFQIEQYGKAVARSGGIGIADMVYREILKAQEAR